MGTMIELTYEGKPFEAYEAVPEGEVRGASSSFTRYGR